MLKRYYNFLENETLEKKIFSFVLLGIIITAILMIITNQIIGYESSANFKWIGAIAIGVGLFYLYVTHKFQYLIEHLVFIALIFYMVPKGYYDSQEDIVLPLGFVFAIVICINLIFQKWERYLYTISVVSMYTFLYIIGFDNFPIEVVNSTNFYDRLITIPVILFGVAIIVAIVLKTYRQEHHLLDQKNQELAEANHKLKVISEIDYLTEIFNRRYIVAELKTLVESINHGAEKSLGILLFDVDNFKAINDTYGQYIGDSILKTIVMELKMLLTNKGIKIGRFGGDEFLVIFHDLKNKEVAQYLEIIQIKIKDQQLPHHINLSISGGYIEYRIDRHRTAEKLLVEANKRLYIAKQSGKDKIIMN